MGNLFGQPTGLSREVCLFAGADWLQLIITSEGVWTADCFLCASEVERASQCVRPPPPGGGCAVGTFCIVTDVVAVVSRPHFKGTIFFNNNYYYCCCHYFKTCTQHKRISTCTEQNWMLRRLHFAGESTQGSLVLSVFSIIMSTSSKIDFYQT